MSALLSSDWRNALRDVITQAGELLRLLRLDPALLPAAQQASQLFPLRVPRAFVRRMRVGDIDDPLLRQVLPLGAETQLVDGFSIDPLGEAQANPVPGLLHKYTSRVLLTITGACGINCRYCFRRHFAYTDNNPSRAEWQAVIDYIAADSRIHEVIFSGGDPLVADDDYLLGLITRIAEIPHVDTLRIHSRMPIVIPERMTTALLQGLAQCGLHVVLVVHSNHSNEIDDTVAQMLQTVRASSITLLNQSVLLRGVNDDVQCLTNLSRALFDVGVLPYYLHILDKVQGAAHFDVPMSEAKLLWRQLQQRLPGYLLPRLVFEKAGEQSKTWI